MKELIKETISQTAYMWELYWGEGMYQYLFLAAAAYLFVRMCRRKYAAQKTEMEDSVKKTAGPLLFYCLCALVMFAFPFTAWVISRCIGKNVYWRVLWLVPVVPVIAIAMTDLIRRRKSIVPKILLAGLCVVCIVSGGKSMIRAGNYQLVHNYQQVPDEAAMICELVRRDAGDGEVCLATDDYIASYARVYDPSITMPYGRRGEGAQNKKSKALYQEIMDGTDFEKVASLALTIGCNYIAAVVPEEEQRAALEKNGFHEIGTVNDYRVFACS